jgi:hypothetical protein
LALNWRCTRRVGLDNEITSSSWAHADYNYPNDREGVELEALRVVIYTAGRDLPGGREPFPLSHARQVFFSQGPSHKGSTEPFEIMQNIRMDLFYSPSQVVCSDLESRKGCFPSLIFIVGVSDRTDCPCAHNGRPRHHAAKLESFIRTHSIARVFAIGFVSMAGAFVRHFESSSWKCKTIRNNHYALRGTQTGTLFS